MDRENGLKTTNRYELYQKLINEKSFTTLDQLRLQIERMKGQEFVMAIPLGGDVNAR